MSNRRQRTSAPPTGFGTTGRRTALGYWLPLAASVTVATAGLAAWVWSEWKDDSEEEEDEDEEHNREHLERRDRSRTAESGAEASAWATGSNVEDSSVASRVQGALRRTPSPQQLFDGASKRVVAGVTAASAAVGGALTSIHEEGNGNFEDHSKWAETSPTVGEDGSRSRSEEQLTMSGALQSQSSKKRKSVAIVVSSDSESTEEHSEQNQTLLSLLENTKPESAKVFVLIYAPGVQIGDGLGSSRPTPSITSSYDNIGREEVTTTESPDDEEVVPVKSPNTPEGFESATPLFKTLYNQAQSLVNKETMIMPFNTPNGHVHILRHLSPDLVYIQENLAGENGDSVQGISGWVRQVMMVIDESTSAKDEESWRRNEAVGPGKRVDVVGLSQFREDWRRQVCSS